MSFSKCFPWMNIHPPLTTISLVILAALVCLISSYTKRTKPRKISSPREILLPFLSPSQTFTLPYPFNLLLGPRDVDSPYGVLRVYQWGTKKGKKVILVRDDITPAPFFTPIAKALVERGCRVLMIGK